MKQLTLILILIGLISCSSPLDKNIFEPLTLEELKTSIKKDTLFEETYKYIQLIKDTVLKTEIDRVKWSDLTYRQIHDFVKFSVDTTYFNPIRKRLKNEWNTKYGPYHEKVDSISNHWKIYKKENSIEQYVDIKVVEIDKEYYSYSRDVKSINLGFKLTPTKGQIEQLRFGYRIEPKLNERKESIYSLLLDKSWCISTTPFSKPTVRYWEVNYTNEKRLKYMTLSELLRDYNIFIEVDQIRKNGKNMSDKDLNIPESISGHWQYENDEFMKDFYVKDIVKEFLNKDYLKEYEYRFQEVDKILKEKDPLSFEFTKLDTKK